MKKKISITIRSDLYEEFIKKTRDAGLRRDQFLNDVLPDEIDYLMQLNPNTARGEKQLRIIRRLFHDSFAKVNLTLDENVIEKLNATCKLKQIPRDIFLEDFIEYLTICPENGECTAPLDKIYSIKKDPRFEYEPSANEITPYDHLSIPDDKVIKSFDGLENAIEMLMKVRKDKGAK